MKSPRLVLLGILVLAGGLAGEVLLGYLLWLRQHRQSAVGHTLAELHELLVPPPPAATRMKVRYEPGPMYAPDPYLGYVARPGTYTVEIRDTGKGRRHRFPVTVNPEGNRITAAPGSGFAEKPEVWVFGNSFVFGWGNRDETTFPYFLQRYLPDRRVVNYAGNGYGTVHAYLQLKRELARARPLPTAIVVAYADYFNERNVAAPSRLATFRAGAAAADQGGFPAGVASDFTHPRARLEGGRLVVDYVPLLVPPETGDEFDDPPEDEQYAVTRRLLGEMHALAARRDIPLVLAFMRGPDDDPVVAAARRRGYVVADLRPDRSRWEWDHFQPFDPHPGPLAQSVFAWKLFLVLRALADDLPTGPTG